MARRKRGLSKLDAIAILGILTLVGVFVLPRVQGLRMAHNEEDAVFALQMLRQRMITLKDRRGGPAIAEQLTPEQLLATGQGERPWLDDCHFEKGADGHVVMRRHG